MKGTIYALGTVLALGCQGQAGDVKLTTQQDKVSYSIGLDIGRSFKDQAMDINAEAMMQGIKDGLTGAAQALSDEEIQTVMEAFQTEMMNKMESGRSEQSENNVKEGREFLEANGKRPGVVTLASGLQYEVITEGTGAMPKADDTVVTHYRGTLINGKVFDSSYDRGEPISFPVGGVIAGWTEALQLMKVGSKWKLYIPAELAYGARGAGPDIGPNATLIFEVELISIK